MHRARVSILYLVACCSAAAVTRSVWDGVYTREQAGRGKDTYRAVCTQCHGESLDGGEAPPLAGEEFLRKWNGKTAGDLFDVIRNKMPEDNPGSLNSPEYADVLAYILSFNDFPAGQKELDRDITVLNEIRIEMKP